MFSIGCFLKVCCFLHKKTFEKVFLSSLNTRRLLWECEKDETPQERMRRGGSTLAKRTKCIQGASLKATIYTKTAFPYKKGGTSYVIPFFNTKRRDIPSFITDFWEFDIKWSHPLLSSHYFSSE